MKVLFTTRASLVAQPGGDTLQIEQTAEALKALGMAVDIKLSGEKRSYHDYDLVHFFNIGRPADIIEDLSKIKVPLVVSAIWVDYSEWEAQQKGLRAAMAKMGGGFGAEYVKTIARAFTQTDRFPGRSYLAKGQRNSMQAILQKAASVVASSSSESARLHAAFGVAEKTTIIPLGINQNVIGEQVGVREGVICVGRIEGLKNQLNLIRASRDATWNLQIIGKPAMNQPKYYRECQLAAGENVSFTGWLMPDHLREAYQAAKVLVLPSYFETFGLVALEALANGCNVVMSNRPDMNSIFGDRVLYCNPNDPEDIRLKIEQALKLPPAKLSKADEAHFSWQNAATQLQAIYKKLLET